jgi:iron complex transport system ATP-binding protein
MSELLLEGLSAQAGGRQVLDQASLRLGSGELIALLGANGAGKTSLLRAALGLLPIAHGRASIDGVDARTLNPIRRARRVTYLPQQRGLAWPVSVADAVALGRFAYGASPGCLGQHDAAAVAAALDDCDLACLAGRRTDTLSGGELARVHCARAFAARTPLLLADEPVASLDPRHQFTVMDLISAFVARGGGALVVLHEVALAARYATRLVWMRDGKIVADGTPADTLTRQQLREVYGVDGTVEAGAAAPTVHITGLA